MCDSAQPAYPIGSNDPKQLVLDVDYDTEIIADTFNERDGADLAT